MIKANASKQETKAKKVARTLQGAMVQLVIGTMNVVVSKSHQMAKSVKADIALPGLYGRITDSGKLRGENMAISLDMVIISIMTSTRYLSR